MLPVGLGPAVRDSRRDESRAARARIPLSLDARYRAPWRWPGITPVTGRGFRRGRTSRP
jgi:hypothetical protein